MLQKKIIISNLLRENLVQHANKQYPYEACAILLGNTNEETWETTEIFLTENMDKSEINFTVSNEQLLEGFSMAEEKFPSLQILGSLAREHFYSAPA